MFHSGIRRLREIEAVVKFVSVEPLLTWNIKNVDLPNTLKMYDLNWLIVGCETRNGKQVQDHQPKIKWIKEIVDAADSAKIPIFLKNNLKSTLIRDSSTQDTSFYEHFKWALSSPDKLRQEFPKEAGKE
jgi:protein gp37